jgi:hypothetical protein
VEDSTFSIKVREELHNDFFLDFDLLIEVLGYSVIMGAGVGSLSFHCFQTLLKGYNGLASVFEEGVDSSGGTSGVLKVKDKFLFSRLKSEVQGGQLSVFDREFGVLCTEVGDIGGDARGIDKAGEKGVDLGDHGFLILGKGTRGFQHAVNKHKDFNSLCDRCVRNFKDGHGRE